MMPGLSTMLLFEASIDMQNIMSRIESKSQQLSDDSASSDEQVKQMNQTMPGSTQ